MGDTRVRAVQQNGTNRVDIRCNRQFVELAYTMWARYANHGSLHPGEAENLGACPSVRRNASAAPVRCRRSGSFLEKWLVFGPHWKAKGCSNRVDALPQQEAKVNRQTAPLFLWTFLCQAGRYHPFSRRVFSAQLISHKSTPGLCLLVNSISYQEKPLQAFASSFCPGTHKPIL